MEESAAWTAEYLNGPLPGWRDRDTKDLLVKSGQLVGDMIYKTVIGVGDTRLVIGKDFEVAFATPMPSRWHRFWCRMLLGWTWKEVT